MSKEIESKIMEIIKVRVEAFKNIETLGSDDDLAELGVNSIMFIKVVVGLEAEFDFEFEEEDLLKVENFRTLRNLAAYIESKTSK